MRYCIESIFLARALDRIKCRYGTPSRADILTFLYDRYRADELLARSWATALDLYWAGGYEASIHLGVVKIEAAARALLLELNEPLYRAEVGESHGQFPDSDHCSPS